MSDLADNNSEGHKTMGLCVKDGVPLDPNISSQNITASLQPSVPSCLPSACLVNEGFFPANSLHNQRSVSSGVQPLPKTFETVPTISLNNHRIPLQSNGSLFHHNTAHYDDQGGLAGQQPYFGQHWGSSTYMARHCDNMAIAKSGNRGRTTYSDEQVAELEEVFGRNPYPTPQARQQLSRDINVPEGKIKIWFQNRRARAKKLRAGSVNWRGFRPAPSVPHGEQNTNNNAASHAPGDASKAPDFASTFQPLATIPDVRSNNWCFEPGEQQGHPVERPPSSLSLSGLSLDTSSKLFSSSQTVGKTTSGRSYSNEPTFVLSHGAGKPVDSSSDQPGLGCGPKEGITVLNSYDEAPSIQDQHGMYYEGSSFPERFPVISSTVDYGTVAAGGSVPLRASYFCLTTADQSSSADASACEVQNGFVPGDNRYFPARIPVLHHSKQYPPTDQPGSPATFEDQVMSKESFRDSHGFYSSRCSNMAPLLLRSPPPIRRFVFPFQNLLENARHTSNAHSTKASSAGNTSTQQCSFRVTCEPKACSDLTGNCRLSAKTSPPTNGTVNSYLGHEHSVLDKHAMTAEHREKLLHGKGRASRDSATSAVSANAKDFWRAEWQMETNKERNAMETQTSCQSVQNLLNHESLGLGDAPVTVSEIAARTKNSSNPDYCSQRKWPAAAESERQATSSFHNVDISSRCTPTASVKNICALTRKQAGHRVWSNGDINQTAKPLPSEPMVG